MRAETGLGGYLKEPQVTKRRAGLYLDCLVSYHLVKFW